MIVSDGLDRVEEAMRRVAAEGSLGESLAHHLRAGGKRLRALLALRAGADLGIAEDDAAAWAIACELLHNATLVHDDLCDRDRTRRGQPSVWAGWGDTAAVCLGDLLLAEAVAAVDGIGPAGPRRELRRRLLDTVRALTRGQAMEADVAAMGVPGVEACRRVADLKTVPLVTLPAAGPLLLAECSEPESEAAERAFACLGRAYQILDDLEDLLADGRDLRQCVPNHGVALFAEAGPAAAGEAFQRAWQSGAAARETGYWLDSIRRSSAMPAGLALAEALLLEAEAHLDRAPAEIEAGFRLLSGHLSRQAAGLRRAVAAEPMPA